MILYEITNKINGKGYVGVTKRKGDRRKTEHFYDLRKNQHDNPRLQNAYNKYGKEVFEFKIREVFNNLEDLNKREAEVLILEKDRLYNIAPGGEAGKAFSHTIESRQKISDSANKKPVIGMSIKTEEIKRYPSVSEVEKDGFSYKNIGRCCTLSVSKNKDHNYTAISHRGWVWMYEKEYSPEEMNKRKNLAIRGKIRFERPVVGKNIETEEIVSFISIKEAQRFLGVSSIAKDCGPNKMGPKKSYVWIYSDLNNWQILLEKKFKGTR